MRPIIRKTLLGGFIVVVALTAPIGYYRWTERVGFKNVEICQKLQPGITLSDLEQALGASTGSWISKSGARWLTFETPSINAGQIRAEIEEPSGRVLTLRCFEDGPPTWTIK